MLTLSIPLTTFYLHIERHPHAYLIEQYNHAQWYNENTTDQRKCGYLREKKFLFYFFSPFLLLFPHTPLSTCVFDSGICNRLTFRTRLCFIFLVLQLLLVTFNQIGNVWNESSQIPPLQRCTSILWLLSMAIRCLEVSTYMAIVSCPPRTPLKFLPSIWLTLLGPRKVTYILSYILILTYLFPRTLEVIQKQLFKLLLHLRQILTHLFPLSRTC